MIAPFALEAERFARLDTLLADHAWLWRPPPFREPRPAWCDELPRITRFLLALPEARVQALSSQPAEIGERMATEIPALADLPRLSQLPPARSSPPPSAGHNPGWGVPGRKLAQIQAFAAAAGAAQAPLLEWCGGKGHLGRLLALRGQTEVLTLEIDPALCASGEALAGRLGARQQFEVMDVTSAGCVPRLAGRHAVALHACGELHRALLRGAAGVEAPAIDLAPCCYYIGSPSHYQPLAPGARLSPRRDDLRLAVTETATARPRELRLRDREMAWKLGYDGLRREVTGEDRYLPIRPVRKPWLALGFEGFCRALAERDDLELPPVRDWTRWERIGWARQRETMRLSLVRLLFRRPLEIWLVSDLGRYLQARGYSVALTTFCPRSVTPRNILISARR